MSAALSGVANAPVTPSSLTLERLLDDLARYGAPRLMQVSNGWHCAVDVKVNATGCEFKVASSYDHKSAHAAAACVHQRLREALRDLGVAGAGGLA